MKKSVFLLFCCLSVMALFIRTGVLSNLPPGVVLLQNKTVGPGDFLCRDATVSITTAGGGTFLNVMNGGGLELVSGQAISLMPGTHIQQGGMFAARITTTATYCDPLKDGPAASVITREVKIYHPSATAAPSERMIHQGKGQLRAYPNPTSAVIHIDFYPENSKAPTQLIVTGIRGELITSEIFPAGQFSRRINLQGYPGGMYVVRVVSDRQVESVQIIKTD